MTENGLTAKEAFLSIFEDMQQKLDGKEIILPKKKPMAVIAYDWSPDGTKRNIGYSVYEKAMIVIIKGREWVIAFGTACGDYPADPFNCDIAALYIPSDGMSENELNNKIYRKLSCGRYFQNSVIVAMADGTLRLNSRGPLLDRLKSLGTGVPEEFIAQRLELKKASARTDSRQVVKRPERYTKEFPAYFSDRICEALMTSI